MVNALVAARMKEKEKRSKERRLKAETKATVRAAISFSSDLYNTLEEIAHQKKVSLAWVERGAAEKYIAEKMAAFGDRGALVMSVYSAGLRRA